MVSTEPQLWVKFLLLLSHLNTNNMRKSYTGIAYYKIINMLLAGFVFFTPMALFAAVTPSLGAVTPYGILSSTYTNTTPTTINGSVGFTTPPAISPSGVHVNYGSGIPYAQAGIDQGTVMSALASQPCTFTFPSGAINLSTDTTHGTAGVYTPGVYCSSGAMNIGGPLNLSGAGTYIFRPSGALTSTAGSVITLNGSSACDIFWTPAQAATLAANTIFKGTIIADAGITVGANTVWSGQGLSFGGTITTDTNTITVPMCTVASLATLHVIKNVVTTGGGVATSSDFTLYVKSSGVNATGSPAFGTTTPGTSYALEVGSYVVSEDASALYLPTFTGDCNASGAVLLSFGDSKTCIVTNTYLGGGTGTSSSEVIGTLSGGGINSTTTIGQIVGTVTGGSVATGTLSGGGFNGTTGTGQINGTVTGGSSGGGGGGGGSTSSGGGGGSINNGLVLGVSTGSSNLSSNGNMSGGLVLGAFATSPSFPNTGIPPGEKNDPLAGSMIMFLLYSVAIVFLTNKNKTVIKSIYRYAIKGLLK